MQTLEEAQEESGWKPVHGDVFAPETSPMLLSVLAGTGVQIFAMVLAAMVFAILGFLSPANRGGLLTAILLLLSLWEASRATTPHGSTSLWWQGVEAQYDLTATLFPTSCLLCSWDSM